jgi:Domain of unknown function (DUF6377)
MRYLFLAFLSLWTFYGYPQQPISSLLGQLDSTIAATPRYDTEKVRNIEALKARGGGSQTPLFTQYLSLYQEYYIFNYDSAYTYARRMQETAARQHNDSLSAYAKIKLGFILLSSGMFKEVFDSLETINLRALNKAQKAEYLTLMARCYYDLADYDHDQFYAPQYGIRGNQYLDSSLLLYPTGSFEYIYYRGLKNVRSHNDGEAVTDLRQLLEKQDLSLHELALVTSTLSDVYIRNGKTDSAISLLIRAAVSDIKSSTKETSAIFNLASLLFRRGELQRASVYIQKAVSDALFYGARQRKVQLSTILPLIEGENLNTVENEKKNLVTYAIIITASFLLLIFLIIVIIRQVNKLQSAKKAITKAHTEQQIVNFRLQESNKIKEEYIGYFFNGNSEFYTRIEKFKKSVESKIADRKLDEISFFVNNLNVKKEREELLKNFDQIFLRLFPNFIESFNRLLKEEDQVRLKEGEFLNTHLRIFALIRLGIHDPEKIAGILQYSVNTINTYKTKIKNKSVVPNEEFEHRIMEISTF